MSGHSKWSTIKRKKGANDAKRGKLFAKLVKAIEIAAKNGGTDPANNASLYQAISKAKSNSVPNDNIERALKRVEGNHDSGEIFELTYEGYGPYGVALLITCLTDNKNRTVGEIRHVLSKASGSLGQSGSVAWNFNRMGIILIEESAIDEDKIFNISVENDAKDFKLEDGYFKLFFDHNALYQKIELIEKIPVEVDSSLIAYIPKDFIKVSETDGEKVEKLIEMLEDLEDV